MRELQATIAMGKPPNMTKWEMFLKKKNVQLGQEDRAAHWWEGFPAVVTIDAHEHSLY